MTTLSNLQIAILLTAKISRGLGLSGNFYQLAESVVLEDSDRDPTITINPVQKTVQIKHQGNIRDILLVGLKAYVLEAGYIYSELQVDPQIPPQIRQVIEAMTGSPELPKPPKKDDVH